MCSGNRWYGLLPNYFKHFLVFVSRLLFFATTCTYWSLKGVYKSMASPMNVYRKTQRDKPYRCRNCPSLRCLYTGEWLAGNIQHCINLHWLIIMNDDRQNGHASSSINFNHAACTLDVAIPTSDLHPVDFALDDRQLPDHCWVERHRIQLSGAKFNKVGLICGSSPLAATQLHALDCHHAEICGPDTRLQTLPVSDMIIIDSRSLVSSG